MTFPFDRVRIEMTANETVRFGRLAANRLRGVLGTRLPAEWFAPRAVDGPSGLRDRPRPFVLRSSALDGRTLERGEAFAFALHLFDTSADVVAAFDNLDWASITSAVRENIVIQANPVDTHRLRVRFLTPTELKSESRIADRPDFDILFARAVERITALAAFYTGSRLGPPQRPDGRLVEWTAHHQSTRRTSTRTGQTHPLGGFTGEAIYEGELREALPWLEIAQQTGVGRQTVWGKGEISVERLG